MEDLSAVQDGANIRLKTLPANGLDSEFTVELPQNNRRDYQSEAWRSRREAELRLERIQGFRQQIKVTQDNVRV